MKKLKIAACVLLALLSVGVVLSLTVPGLSPKVIWIRIIKMEIRRYTVDNADMQRFYVSSDYTSPDAYIAHGGGIDGFEWSNCEEAVQDSIQRGFKFIEIDMIATSDGHIIGGHDWAWVKKISGIENPTDEPMSLDEAKKLKINGRYTPVDGARIAQIMRENPDVFIVVDKMVDCERLFKEIPFPDRLIIEVGNIRQYMDALHAGAKYVAMNVSSLSAANAVKECHIPIVTVSAAAFVEDPGMRESVQELHDRKVTVMVFDSRYETAEFLRKYLGRSISKMYTGHWAPTRLPHEGE